MLNKEELLIQNVCSHSHTGPQPGKLNCAMTINSDQCPGTNNTILC